jgi:hypothetical protein
MEVNFMNLSCDKRCGFIRMLANLRCPGCFGIEVNPETKGGCDCKITINPEKIWGWE